MSGQIGGISTHALREEGDRPLRARTCRRPRFLPTPSARRATISEKTALRWNRISTHALREEGDIVWTPLHSVLLLFLPTPSARRATRKTSGWS